MLVRPLWAGLLVTITIQRDFSIRVHIQCVELHIEQAPCGLLFDLASSLCSM